MFSELFNNCLFDYLCQINNAHFDGPNTFRRKHSVFVIKFPLEFLLRYSLILLNLYLLNIVTYYFNSLYNSVVLNSNVLSFNQNICRGYSKNRLNESKTYDQLDG